MRRSTPGVREAQVGAVHASRTCPITLPALLRTLVISSAIGVFLSFVGAFGTEDVPFLTRTIYMTAVAWVGALVGVGVFRLIDHWIGGRPLWLRAAVSATAMTPVMTLVVWGGTWLFSGGGVAIRHLPGFAFNSLIMCLVMTGIGVSLNRRRESPPAAEAAPPKFLDRLPLKLRGAEVWAVEAEDHYLRLHTSRGQDLILMRLADAVAELEGIEGAQVHRSWWVARDAITEAERGDGRAILTLKDGGKVPVSRTYAKIIREKGWI